MEDEDARFHRWYGDWEPLDLAGVRELMAGFDRPWWVIGGWSIELFTGVSRPHDDLDDVTWEHEGVRVLRPEITLLMKARLARPKDRADLEVTWPLLDDDRRAWLRHMLGRAHPGHDWLTLLADEDTPDRP